MSDALTFRRLRYTPLRDLVRGRVSDRLNWRARVDAAALPAPAADAVRRIVRRTRLWRLERAAVADELIAHFADGLAHGATADDLVRDFGDERAAAKLIRRAKRRNRPLAWHALKWAGRGLLVLAALYGVVLARFLVGRPTVSVDYTARLNAPVVGVPVEDRAWPAYREAMLALDVHDKKVSDPLNREIAPKGPDDFLTHRTLLDTTPLDPQWSDLTAWLDAHAEGLALLRGATAKPAMGFVLGPDGSAKDPALGWNFKDTNPSLIAVLLPNLNHMRQLADVLAADLRYARARRDAGRVKADLVAMLGLARHQDAPILVTRLVGLGIYSLAFQQLEEVLASDPALLDDRQLIDLAHRVSTVGGDAAGSLIDLSTERFMFHDTIQRSFTDDGNGDGRLTPEGVRHLANLLSFRPYYLADARDDIGLFAMAGAVSTVTSRRDLIAEFDRLIDLQERAIQRPLRESGGDDGPRAAFLRRVAEIRGDPVLLARYFVVARLIPELSRAGWTAERVLGRREGVTIGLALELHRRRHGAYPATLDALVPTMLPRVPADRITGEPVRYALVDGWPVVYSVGVDRDDDAGRAAAYPKNSRPDPFAAAAWPAPDDAASRVDGDWILYDARPPAE